MAAPIHIALIDDDPAVLDSLRLYFARQGLMTSCFCAAEEFLAAVDRSTQFDCIVSDVRMPGASGLELVRRKRTRLLDLTRVASVMSSSPSKIRRSFD